MLLRNETLNCCDDVVGFNATDSPGSPNLAEDGPATDFLSRENTYSRFRPDFTADTTHGAVFTIRGGKRIRSFRDTITGGVAEGYDLKRWMDVEEIEIVEPTIANTELHAMRIEAGCHGRAANVTVSKIGVKPRILNESRRFKIGKVTVRK